jgi:hypothetical protein
MQQLRCATFLSTISICTEIMSLTWQRITITFIVFLPFGAIPDHLFGSLLCFIKLLHLATRLECNNCGKETFLSTIAICTEIMSLAWQRITITFIVFFPFTTFFCFFSPYSIKMFMTDFYKI